MNTATLAPSAMAERYKLAADQVLLNWPSWKVAIIEDHRAKGTHSHFIDEYVAAVAEMAENEALPLSM